VKVKHKLYLSLATMILLMAVVGVISYRTSEHIRGVARELTHYSTVKHRTTTKLIESLQRSELFLYKVLLESYRERLAVRQGSKMKPNQQREEEVTNFNVLLAQSRAQLLHLQHVTRQELHSEGPISLSEGRQIESELNLVQKAIDGITGFELQGERYMQLIRFILLMKSRLQGADHHLINRVLPIYQRQLMSILDELRGFHESAVESDSARIIKSIQEATYLIAFTTLFSIIVAIIFGVVLARSISRPLKQLTHVTARVEEGDLDARVEGDLGGELGELGQRFNAMVAAVLDGQTRMVRSAKMSSIGELAAGVAHEINNPLGTIEGNLDILTLKLKQHGISDDHGIERAMGRLYRTLKRLTQIVQRLTGYARSVPDEILPIDTHLLIKETVGLVSEIYRKNGIDLQVVLGANNHWVMGNGGKFQQVLMNLLSNAQHALEQDPEKRITIESRDHDEGLLVLVTDSGQGILPEHLEKIFDPFFTTRVTGKGTGLGLDISKMIMREMDGVIRVGKTGPQGTAFELLLPTTTAIDSEQSDS
jgi:signal transduction histidine kinase